MRLLALTDLHGSREALERILHDAGSVDVVLLGGDITNFGAPDDVAALVETILATGRPVWAVAGNCDSAEIAARLETMGVSLAGRGVVVEGTGFFGLPAMPPWLPRMYQFTEPELAAMLESGRAQVAEAPRRVLLSHCPPRGLLDQTALGRSVGSTSLRTFLDQAKPELVLCGHIHEARGVQRHGPTTIVNCGPAVTGSYALVEMNQEIEVELRRVRP
ncbi:MAG: metallophosphoesterase family protein [Pirellulales bacterium]|nr:metallophosphoesterase family protein [Pirellulales bacterium]